MPGTVDDFMRRFGGDGAIDDREAEHYYDRFASTHSDDRGVDTDTMAQGTTEYLGQLPDEHFEHAAHQAFTQSAPRAAAGVAGQRIERVAGARCRSRRTAKPARAALAQSHTDGAGGVRTYRQLCPAAASGRDGRAGPFPALVRPGHGQSDRDGSLGSDCVQAAPALSTGWPSWPPHATGPPLDIRRRTCTRHQCPSLSRTSREGLGYVWHRLKRFSLECTVSTDHLQATTKASCDEPDTWH